MQKENSARLLGIGDIAARTGLQGGRQGARGIRCYTCQSPGHLKPECTVTKNKLYCAHCCKRGEHDTNKFCKAYKKAQTKDETAGEGGQWTNKDSTKKGKKEFTHQTTTETGKEDKEEDEKSGSGSDSGAILILSRAQWLPSYSADSDQESDFEFQSSEDTAFITSDFDTG